MVATITSSCSTLLAALDSCLPGLEFFILLLLSAIDIVKIINDCFVVSVQLYGSHPFHKYCLHIIVVALNLCDLKKTDLIYKMSAVILVFCRSLKSLCEKSWSELQKYFYLIQFNRILSFIMHA